MKNWLPRLINALSRPLGRLGVCGNSGVIAGAIVGGVLGLLRLGHDGPMSSDERLLVTSMLAGFAWLALLFVFTAFVRYRLAPIALPALVNATLVAFTTSYGLNELGLSNWAGLLGMVIGALIGIALCALNSLWEKGRRHGLRSTR